MTHRTSSRYRKAARMDAAAAYLVIVFTTVFGLAGWLVTR